MKLTFIKRNMPIFIIGGLTVAVFVVLIIISSGKNPEGIRMDQITDENSTVTNNGGNETESGYLEEEYTYPGIELKATNNYVPVGVPEDLQHKYETSKHFLSSEDYQPVYIRFTDEGFDPKTVSVFEEQVLVWKNETKSTITLMEITNFYDEFEEGVEIAPGQSYSITAKEIGIWKIREKASQKLLTISTIAL